MALSNKLCNPTPFNVVIPYGRGESIHIPGYSVIELRNEQVDDFTPSKPGYANVREMLDSNGLFLMDPDRSYDAQALGAIRKSIKFKQDLYDAGVESVQNLIVSSGTQFSEDNFKKRMDRAGYSMLKGKLEVLREQESHFEKVVNPEELSETLRVKTYDPTRTVFPGNKPPIEFPSTAAMNFFLSRPENKETKKAHDAYLKSMADQVKQATKNAVVEG